MKYITLLLTFVYGSLAVATFLTAGTDPVMNIMAFICLTGALGFGFVTDRLFALAEEKQMLLDEWRNAPAHAVDDNQPDWERIQNEPAYLRRQTEEDRKLVEDDWTWSPQAATSVADAHGGLNPWDYDPKDD